MYSRSTLRWDYILRGVFFNYGDNAVVLYILYNAVVIVWQISMNRG